MAIKDYKVEELYKKCGFKKSDGFVLQTEWKIKIDGHKYLIHLYGKTDGKANFENKYDFPPPVDNKLFFGSCLLVCFNNDSSIVKEHVHLTIELWNKMYEKLFGGFEDLTQTAKEDENEVDELEFIPKSMKTKVGGYLKDGFVVDDTCSSNVSTDSNYSTDDSAYEEDCDSRTDEDSKDDNQSLEEICSELSEEEYVDGDNDDSTEKKTKTNK